MKGCGVIVVVVVIDMMSYFTVPATQHGPIPKPAASSTNQSNQKSVIPSMKSVVNREEPPKWIAPCLVVFRATGVLKAPDENTKEGVAECQNLADEWSRKRNVDRAIIKAWCSRDVTRDKSNPDELKLFQYETSIRTAVYKIWEVAKRSTEHLESIVARLMKKYGYQPYRPTRKQIKRQLQLQVG